MDDEGKGERNSVMLIWISRDKDSNYMEFWSEEPSYKDEVFYHPIPSTNLGAIEYNEESTHILFNIPEETCSKFELLIQHP